MSNLFKESDILLLPNWKLVVESEYKNTFTSSQGINKYTNIKSIDGYILYYIMFDYTKSRPMRIYSNGRLLNTFEVPKRLYLFEEIVNFCKFRKETEKQKKAKSAKFFKKKYKKRATFKNMY